MSICVLASPEYVSDDSSCSTYTVSSSDSVLEQQGIRSRGFQENFDYFVSKGKHKNFIIYATNTFLIVITTLRKIN